MNWIGRELQSPAWRLFTFIISLPLANWNSRPRALAIFFFVSADSEGAPLSSLHSCAPCKEAGSQKPVRVVESFVGCTSGCSC